MSADPPVVLGGVACLCECETFSRQDASVRCANGHRKRHGQASLCLGQAGPGRRAGGQGFRQGTGQEGTPGGSGATRGGHEEAPARPRGVDRASGRHQAARNEVCVRESQGTPAQGGACRACRRSPASMLGSGQGGLGGRRGWARWEGAGWANPFAAPPGGEVAVVVARRAPPRLVGQEDGLDPVSSLRKLDHLVRRHHQPGQVRHGGRQTAPGRAASAAPAAAACPAWRASRRIRIPVRMLGPSGGGVCAALSLARP